LLPLQANKIHYQLTFTSQPRDYYTCIFIDSPAADTSNQWTCQTISKYLTDKKTLSLLQWQPLLQLHSVQIILVFSSQH